MSDESRPDPSQPRDRIGSKAAPFFSSGDASMLGLGSQMMSEVVAGVLLGYGVDYLLGTKNRWIVVGAIVGVVVAMVTVIKFAMRAQRPQRKPGGGDGTASKERQRPSGPGQL